MITEATKKELLAPQTSKLFANLVEIRHDAWPTPLRFIDAQIGVVSTGAYFSPRAFDVSPGDVNAKDATGSLTMDDVDRAITWALQNLSGPAPSVYLTYIRVDDPDEPIDGPFPYEVGEVHFNPTSGQVELQLKRIGRFDYNLGTDAYSANLFPGLYG